MAVDTTRKSTDRKAQLSKQAVANGNAEEALDRANSWKKLANHLLNIVTEKEQKLKRTQIQNSIAAIGSDDKGINPHSLPKTSANKTYSHQFNK